MCEKYGREIWFFGLEANSCGCQFESFSFCEKKYYEINCIMMFDL